MKLFWQLADWILRSGPDALDAMAQLSGDDAEPLRRLVNAGLLTHRDDAYGLTAKAIREIERAALADVIARLNHVPRQLQPVSGDRAVSEQELTTALRGILCRTEGTCPLTLGPADIDRYAAECTESVAVALLVDMSYSMSSFDRFYQAKKIALALHALVGERFPEDSIDVIGFYSKAEPIDPDRIPLLMPRPVSLVDKQVALRLPLAKAYKAPQHFTNLQMALDLAGTTLADRPGRNKHAFIVLDGEPTAFVEDGQLVIHYPPDEQTAAATIASARTLARDDVRLTTFALIDDYYYMDWVAFVDRMTRSTRGISFYCSSDELPGCVMESYITGKR